MHKSVPVEKKYQTYSQRFLWLTVFGTAMGFLEAIVVIYLREIYYPDGFTFPLALMEPDILSVEWIREISTLVMLGAIGILAGRTNLQRLFYSLFVFGVWDIVYYAGLKVLIGWPSSFLTWDLLFLIPIPWLGPVIAPVICSVLMMIMALIIIRGEEGGFRVKIPATDWILIFGGGLVILYTFLSDYLRLIIASGALSHGSRGNGGEKLIEMMKDFVPGNYNWLLFFTGLALIMISTARITIRINKLNGYEKSN